MSSSRHLKSLQATRRADSPALSVSKNLTTDDFFTDSVLDKSKIPSPSPTKPAAGAPTTSRPRRALGDSRTLKAAWDATGRLQNNSTSNEVPRPRLPHPQPAPVQTQKLSPRPSRPNLPQPALSPESTEHIPDLASPTSESSPPTGLTDVYQRIADEEDLAAQEGDLLEHEEFTAESLPGATAGNAFLKNDRARLERMRLSQSPVTLRDSRHGNPQFKLHGSDKENCHTDEMTGLSAASGFSFLQSITDRDLAEKLTPHTIDHAKDRARLDRAIQKDSPIAFSKAILKSRSGLTAENLKSLYSNGLRLEDEQHETASSGGSAATERSEPPPNVPRSWGTKGKVGREWLRKSRTREENPGADVKQSAVPESSQIDWGAAAANMPLPSVERNTSSIRSQSEQLTPVALHEQRSLDRVRQWELNDFTGHSLQMSDSPAVKVRTIVLDQIREKEIETLEKRAVTTNRLGELRKQDSREQLPKSSRSPGVGVDEVQNHKGNGTLDGSAAAHVDAAGEPIPGTPIVIYRNSRDHANNADAKQEVPLPIHERKDSRNNLQRLARVMSDSPQPSPSPEDWSIIAKEEVLRPASASPTLENFKPRIVMDDSRKSSKQVVNVGATPQREEAADLAKTPLVTGAWTDGEIRTST